MECPLRCISLCSVLFRCFILFYSFYDIQRQLKVIEINPNYFLQLKILILNKLHCYSRTIKSRKKKPKLSVYRIITRALISNFIQLQRANAGSKMCIDDNRGTKKIPRETNQQTGGVQNKRERKRNRTVTASVRIELCLDDHVSDEIGGLVGLCQKLLDLCFGGDIPVFLELLPHLRRRSFQHLTVAGE